MKRLLTFGYKKKLLHSKFLLTIPIPAVLFGSRSLLQNVSPKCYMPNNSIYIYFLNEVKKMKRLWREILVWETRKFPFLKQEPISGFPGLWLWNLEMIPWVKCTSLSTRFIPQALADQRRKNLPLHISGARGGKEQIISPLLSSYLGHIYVNFPLGSPAPWILDHRSIHEGEWFLSQAWLLCRHQQESILRTDV